MPSTTHWPYNFTEMKKNKKGQTTYTFAPTEVTIKRIFEPKLDGSKMQFSTGWSFKEDQTPSGDYVGVIWSHGGHWDAKANGGLGAFVSAFGEWDGEHVGAAGQRAKVTLGLTEGDGRNFYNLFNISLLEGSETSANGSGVAEQPEAPSSPAPDGTGAGNAPSDPIQVRISRGQAMSLRAEVFGSLVQATDKRLKDMGVTVEQLQVQLGTLVNAISILDTGRQPTIDELDATPEDDEEPEEEMGAVEDEPEEDPFG